jgi:hypothetical protein
VCDDNQVLIEAGLDKRVVAAGRRIIVGLVKAASEAKLGLGGCFLREAGWISLLPAAGLPCSLQADFG